MAIKAFGTKTIKQWIKADGGDQWIAKFDLGLEGGVLRIELDVKLKGADAGALRTVWQTGIEQIWNQKIFFTDGRKLIPVVLDFDFVTSGQHHTVKVHTGTATAEMHDWYLTTPWGPPYDGQVAAHEVGHMIGAYDEYKKGATKGHFITDNSLMSDLVVGGFERYFATVRKFAQKFSGADLKVVAAQAGSALPDLWAGSSGNDGYYALEGGDTVSGGGGNDYLDGGLGDDRLIGGGGKDTLVGGEGRDTFVIADNSLKGSRDKILDFDPAEDLIALDLGLLTPLVKKTSGVAEDSYFDSLYYDDVKGVLYYDTNGSDYGGRVKLAVIGRGIDLDEGAFLFA